MVARRNKIPVSGILGVDSNLVTGVANVLCLPVKLNRRSATKITENTERQEE